MLARCRFWRDALTRRRITFQCDWISRSERLLIPLSSLSGNRAVVLMYETVSLNHHTDLSVSGLRWHTGKMDNDTSGFFFEWNAGPEISLTSMKKEMARAGRAQRWGRKASPAIAQFPSSEMGPALNRFAG